MQIANISSRDYYHYTECGLNNAYIHINNVVINTNETIVLNIAKIHRCILEQILDMAVILTPAYIRYLRTELGLSYLEFDELCGIPANTCEHIETGKVIITTFINCKIKWAVATTTNCKKYTLLIDNNCTKEDVIYIPYMN